MRMFSVFSGFFFLMTTLAWSQTGEEIIRKLEDLQNPAFATISGSMSLKDRFGDRTITFLSRSRGEDKMLIEFTSDAEAGQKILRLGSDLYLYYPDAEKTITLKGAALGDSVLGSDVSYEDLTGNTSLLDSYTVTLKGTETVMDRSCWVVELRAKTRDATYETQILWIDQEENVTRLAHQFARSGRLLRTMQVLETKRFGSLILGTKMIMADQLRRGTSTTFTLDKVDLATSIPETRFSLRELGR